jgi:hypothetical protein
VKQPCSLNQVYSMIPAHKSSEYLYEITTGETEWGVDGEGGRERKRAAD